MAKTYNSTMTKYRAMPCLKAISRTWRERYDPGSAFRNVGYFNYDIVTNTTIKPISTTISSTTSTPSSTSKRASSTRNPFEDPNRYRISETQGGDDIRFVNGRPYREPPNIQDRFGNRYDPRYHLLPGTYDPHNDPRFSDPRYKDPRNLPKYNNNQHKVPKDRYDSKYRYYERFPDRQRDRLRDPNYDPRYDPEDPPVPGVLGGWLPELQGECRPGCENLMRDVTVNTNYGRVNGFLVNLYDGPRVPEFERPGVANVDKVKATVSVFLGIPYAQPPINHARFMPPRAHGGWQSYNAVDWAPVCPQPIRYVGATKNSPLMDENCLFLNVFTPTVESGQSQLFPVMFYIHGGEFQHGSGNEFSGHQLSYWGRVVVVTINYRLGALGFLSTGDQHAPGNYGLLDQAMALKWVYDNIYAFQGDREKITVFGPGAGGASAGILAVMPKTKNMVRRVISMSGSPFADWATIRDKFRAMNTSLVFGERVGCTIDSSWKLVDCLRKGRKFHDLANIEFKPEIGTWPWAPIIQKNISVPEEGWYQEWTSDDFMALPELVEVLYENQEYNPSLEYMTGVAKDDAAYMIYNNKTLAPDYKVDWKFFDMMVKDHIKQYNYTLNPEGIFNAIKYMYTYYPDPDNVSHIREEFINFYSDFFFRAPQDAMVKTLVQNRVDTYMYVQNTTVEALKLPYWREIKDKQVTRFLWTESDRNMSEFFIYAFSNFSWYEHGEVLKYLTLNTTENSTMLWNYRQRECSFWTEYLPSVIGYITPTYPPTTEFWWEPESPLQIAFWSMLSACLLLIVMVVICCLLWRNARRQVKDRFMSEAGSMKDFSMYQSGTLPMNQVHNAYKTLPETNGSHYNDTTSMPKTPNYPLPPTPTASQRSFALQDKYISGGTHVDLVTPVGVMQSNVSNFSRAPSIQSNARVPTMSMQSASTGPVSVDSPFTQRGGSSRMVGPPLRTDTPRISTSGRTTPVKFVPGRMSRSGSMSGSSYRDSIPSTAV
ncbi:Esterase FE4,Venom carboxylesterase-6,Carboxylesterase 3 [Lepeophtheirus salmonis]|uniref:Esterase FE4,Venom carboxylesterase-6,Carboxylesterase 3 n=1 Tax=Lepeophtheirus salmonis TaxID=72036 RepID=A0A7R8D0I2_LEPSM|nr:Esterase FE4,Venom carboxylesterase-6,Carboxylesterase 3 [Lepeophtheirus salmonis]CAF2959044.1 Esterase FE4,Venom carboxylesterase-6,Carboxylesterase 3 [Lepeophtheirus salmonis]